VFLAEERELSVVGFDVKIGAERRPNAGVGNARIAAGRLAPLGYKWRPLCRCVFSGRARALRRRVWRENRCRASSKRGCWKRKNRSREPGGTDNRG